MSGKLNTILSVSPSSSLAIRERALLIKAEKKQASALTLQ